jgi:hypothetical protein
MQDGKADQYTDFSFEVGAMAKGTPQSHCLRVETPFPERPEAKPVREPSRLDVSGCSTRLPEGTG